MADGRNTKILSKHIFLILIISVYLFILNIFHIFCPFRYVFGIPCPACGTTRAVERLLMLDFSGYCFYNVLAVPLFALFILAVHSKKLSERSDFIKKYIQFILGIGALIVFVVYLFRIIPYFSI